MSEDRGFPWVFPYVEERRSREHPFSDRPLLRPAVRIRFVGPAGSEGVLALVDSGSDHVLAGPWVAQAIGVDLTAADEFQLLIGGSARPVRFAPVQLLLPPPDGDLTLAVEWECDVGFFDRWEPPWAAVLGQVGFFDHFTVMMSRMTMAVALEAADEMDKRLGVPPVDPPEPPPRFTP